MQQQKQQRKMSFRVVVGSHVNYGLALGYMLQSIKDRGFPMGQVIVVIAGAEADALVDKGPDDIVILYARINAYDLTHVSAIHRHIDHPRIAADAYVVVHDCCLAQEAFPERVEASARELLERDLDVLYACADRKLGLATLSRSFYERFGPRYDRTLPKTEAWDAEEQRPRSLAYGLAAGPDKTAHADCRYFYGPGSRIYPGSDIVRHPIQIDSLGIVKFVANNDADKNPPWEDRIRP